MFNRKKLVIEILILFTVFALGAVFINNFFKPVILFVILFIITLPFDNILRKKVSNSSFRALISVFFINVLIIIIGAIIGGFFYNKIIVLMKSGAVNSLNNIKVLLINLESNIKYEYIANKLYGELTRLSGLVLTKSVSVTSSGLSTYFFANIMLFFSIKDRSSIFAFIQRVLGERMTGFLIGKFHEFRKYIKVQVVMVVLSSIQLILGFFILGVDDAISYGVVCGVLDILPIVGILMVFLPLILINLYYKKYILVVGLIALYLYIVISREILQAKLSSSTLNIHPLILFVSVYVGFKIQGFTGAIMILLCSITVKELIFSYSFEEGYSRKRDDVI